MRRPLQLPAIHERCHQDMKFSSPLQTKTNQQQDQLNKSHLLIPSMNHDTWTHEQEAPEHLQLVRINFNPLQTRWAPHHHPTQNALPPQEFTTLHQLFLFCVPVHAPDLDCHCNKVQRHESIISNRDNVAQA